MTTTIPAGQQYAVNVLPALDQHPTVRGEPTVSVNLSTNVDAAPVRATVRSVMATGIGLRRFAELSGVSYSTLSRLMYCGRPFIHAANARRITCAASKALADPGDALASGAVVDATGTRRRAQALIAWGHTEKVIAPLVPMCREHLQAIARGEVDMVTARVARGMRAAYDQLWDKPPPSATPGQRRTTTLARRRAERHGWPVPMAWDDDEIDDPATPVPAGWRRGKGVPSVDIAADFAELAARHPDRFAEPERVRGDIAARLGMSRHTLDTKLARAARSRAA